MHLSLWAVQ